MPDPAPVVPPSPFASILAWSLDKPDWQRDALRRIVETGTLTSADLEEAAAICRTRHGLLAATKTATTPVPLAAAHTPGGVDGTASVSLTRLADLQNVGRLSSDQEILFGSAPGLTVIYGENGTGKSGYARVVKKACRARGMPQDIKPNAFDATATGPATAKIVCHVGAMDTPIDWTDGNPTAPLLSNIFVFDSFSARVHVAEDGPASFKPRGLDVLPELAKACDHIKAGLQAEIDAAFNKNTETARGWTYKAATKAGALVNSLGSTTKSETIEVATLFTPAEDARLNEITSMLSADPRIRAADTKAAATRIRDFANTAKARATSVDDTALKTLGDLIKDTEVTTKAALVAAGPELKVDDLPGSCNATWLKLWEAAKAYSVADAYPGKEFPVTETGARCILCQQELQPDATERYARFNRFVANETRARANAVRAKVTAIKPLIDSLAPISTGVAGVKADLDREAAGLFATSEAFATAVDTRIAHAQKCLRDEEWSDPSPLAASPFAELIALADRLDARAKNELAAADPEKAKALSAERDELTDKKWLLGKKAEVLAQIERYKLVALLKKCQEDCTTNAITIKSGELHEVHVTEAFCKAFADELKALGMTPLPVKLVAARGAKGERRFAVKLDAATTAKVSDIASEGEHRCIALASFLAELSQASHRSALVFDDPVSSLDHAHRAKVAARLVKEAQQRQVIVFTHDVVFLSELFDSTEVSTPTTRYMHLHWNGDTPGYCDAGLPWDWKKYTDRLDALEKEQRQITKTWSTIPNPANVADIRDAYTHLSATLERIVQDVILNGVIGRYRDWVKIEKLTDVAGFTSAECEEVLRIEKKCSGITSRHDPAAAKNAPVPDPAELLQDIDALKSLVSQVKARRSAAKTAGSVAPTATIAEAKPAAAPIPHA